MDQEGGKRQREEEEEAQQADKRAIAPFLSTDFLHLPPTALAKIITEYGLTIAQMHALCTANKTFGRICAQADVWKRAFIARFVKQRGDRRDVAKFEEWADEPLVQRWDAVAAERPQMRGFTHLAAEAFLWRAGNMEHPTLETTGFTMAVLGEATGGLFPLLFQSTELISKAAIRRQTDTFIGPCGLRVPVEAVRESSTEGSYFVHLRTSSPRCICVIAHLLESGWKNQYRAHPILPTNCALCAAPATLQCSGCDKLYCGPKCASQE